MVDSLGTPPSHGYRPDPRWHHRRPSHRPRRLRRSRRRRSPRARRAPGPSRPLAQPVRLRHQPRGARRHRHARDPAIRRTLDETHVPRTLVDPRLSALARRHQAPPTALRLLLERRPRARGTSLLALPGRDERPRSPAPAHRRGPRSHARLPTLLALVKMPHSSVQQVATLQASCPSNHRRLQRNLDADPP